MHYIISVENEFLTFNECLSLLFRCFGFKSVKPHVARIDTAVLRPKNVISVHPLDCCLQSFSPSFGFSLLLFNVIYLVESWDVTLRQVVSCYIATQCLVFLTEIVEEIEGRSAVSGFLDVRPVAELA